MSTHYADINVQVQNSTNNVEESPAWSKDAQEATPADGDEDQTPCTERWKAAQNDNLKRMWAIYRETGIFLSACRHGMIWWICDMVSSGELYVNSDNCILTLTKVLVLNTRSQWSTRYSIPYLTGRGSVTILDAHSPKPSRRARSGKKQGENRFASWFLHSTAMHTSAFVNYPTTPSLPVVSGLRISKRRRGSLLPLMDWPISLATHPTFIGIKRSICMLDSTMMISIRNFVRSW